MLLLDLLYRMLCKFAGSGEWYQMPYKHIAGVIYKDISLTVMGMDHLRST